MAEDLTDYFKKWESGVETILGYQRPLERTEIIIVCARCAGAFWLGINLLRREHRITRGSLWWLGNHWCGQGEGFLRNERGLIRCASVGSPANPRRACVIMYATIPWPSPCNAIGRSFALLRAIRWPVKKEHSMCTCRLWQEEIRRRWRDPRQPCQTGNCREIESLNKQEHQGHDQETEGRNAKLPDTLDFEQPHRFAIWFWK